MFKIKIHNDSEKLPVKGTPDVHDEIKNDDEHKNKAEKIEICYFCLKKFDMNKDDLSHYKYGKYPMCDYCSEFYGFYSD